METGAQHLLSDPTVTTYECVCALSECVFGSVPFSTRGHAGAAVLLHSTFLPDSGQYSTQRGVRTSHICKAAKHNVKKVTFRQMS